MYKSDPAIGMQSEIGDRGVPALAVMNTAGYASVSSGGYIPLQVNKQGELSVNLTQNVITDINNGYASNLSSGATFTGVFTSTLGVAGIQVSLKTDQNCIIYVEQSPDSYNWDISDSYNYYASLNNFGVTVQAINSYVRVRVKNIGSQDTTYFRLQTALCPIAEAVPRSLDANSNFKVAIQSCEDKYGFIAENTPMGEERSVSPSRLVGATFTGTVVDSNFWTATVTSAGSVTQANAQVILATSTTANSTAILQTVRSARYLGGSANRFRAVIRIPDAGTTNNTRRWGAFDGTDGCYFQLNGTTLGVGTIKTGVASITTSGGFNGVLGSIYTAGTNVSTYEIYWTNSRVWFVIGDKLLHTFSASSTTWADNTNLPVRLDNINASGGTASVNLNCRTATIYRLGQLQTQPISNYQSGQVAQKILKYGPGVLHSLLISGVSNTSNITLFDGITTAGTTLYSTGSMGAQTIPFALDMKGLVFSNGLTMNISGANSTATVVYE